MSQSSVPAQKSIHSKAKAAQPTILSETRSKDADEQLGAVYRVGVALDRGSITVNNQTIKLKAGQTANAEIIDRRHCVADVLLDPIKQLQKGGINLYAYNLVEELDSPCVKE